jgi:DNA mismatch repair protein MutS2
LENLLLEVETLKSQIEKENRSVQQNKKTLDKLITEYESKVSSIRKKHDDMDQKIAEELGRLVKESRSKIEHVVKDIREKEASRETILEAQNTLKTIQKAASKRTPKKQKSAVQKISGNIEVNSWVTVDGISGRGQIVEIQVNKKKAAVNINGKLLWVTPGSLHPAQTERELPESRPIIGIQSGEIASYKLDLRGMHLEEARDALERFLDRALLSGLNQIQIIHGKGTGALQKMTHDVLKSTPGIRKFNFENFDRGGTGATIVEL